MTIIAIVDTGLIQDTSKRVLQMAEEMNIDSTVFLTALADAMAITCAVFREEGRPYQRSGIDIRLEQFNDRARDTYAKTIKDMVDHRVMTNAMREGKLRT